MEWHQKLQNIIDYVENHLQCKETVTDNGAGSQGTTSEKEIQTEQRPRGKVKSFNKISTWSTAIVKQ